MWRAFALLAVTGSLVLGPAASASAHPTRSFRACVTFTLTSPQCYSGQPITAGLAAGDRAFFRARVQPAHAGAQAQAWRVRPGARVWHQVGTTAISAEGRIRWTWQTRQADYVGNDQAGRKATKRRTTTIPHKHPPDGLPLVLLPPESVGLGIDDHTSSSTLNAFWPE